MLVPKNVAQLKSILVICPNWVGDFVMATPVFRTLRNHFCHAQITLCMKPGLSRLLEAADWYDSLLIYDKRNEHRNLRGWGKFLLQLRSKSYDMAIILPNSLRSGIIARCSGANIRIGYHRFAGLMLLSHSLKRLRTGKEFLPVYMGEYYRKLLHIAVPNARCTEMELPIASKMHQQARAIWQQTIRDQQNLKIIITPGAAFGSSKLWPQKYYCELIAILGQRYAPAFLLAPGPSEDAMCYGIQHSCEYPVTVLPSADGHLGVLAALIAEADLLISNDTGPRHIAHALKTPTIVLMGPTDPRHSSNPAENAIILRHMVECAPCHLKQCPYEHHRCMTGITPIHVVQAIEKWKVNYPIAP